ncbi:hypothetical protein DUI87_14296 [Hirundo rustica rustica]|uniref:Uncharacterized protein n=1 Tax=Hirundo rustica rustica TaxID=333673 RepID=A0A3M0K7Y8_HIRRU|nr:hypothetical protein DUI87_14296 [Hirundo rustica rustica]
MTSLDESPAPVVAAAMDTVGFVLGHDFFTFPDVPNWNGRGKPVQELGWDTWMLLLRLFHPCEKQSLGNSFGFSHVQPEVDEGWEVFLSNSRLSKEWRSAPAWLTKYYAQDNYLSPFAKPKSPRRVPEKPILNPETSTLVKILLRFASLTLQPGDESILQGGCANIMCSRVESRGDGQEQQDTIQQDVDLDLSEQLMERKDTLTQTHVIGEGIVLSGRACGRSKWE